MGQEQSSNLRRKTPTRLIVLVEKMTNHAATLKRIANLSYDEFVDTVQVLNEMIEPFSQQSGKQLIFAVTPGCDDTSFLWRAIIRIKCLKVDRTDGRLESSRTLNLHQFIRLHNEIMNQIDVAQSMPEFQSTNLMDASVLIDRITETCAHVDTETCAAEECCICMDRKARIMLSCNHNYCEQCIDAWSTSLHTTCPLCRQEMEGADGAWVVAEKPDSSQLQSDVQDYLLGITDIARTCPDDSL